MPLPPAAPADRGAASTRTVVLTVVLASLACLGTGAVLAWCSAFGCAPFEEPFEPDGRAAREARTAARERVHVDLDTLLAGSVVSSTVEDRCTAGEYGWKRRDTWSHVCTVVAERVVVLAPDDLLGALLRTEEGARDLGCRPLPGDAVAERLPVLPPDARRPGEPVVLDLGPGRVGAWYPCRDGTSSVEVRLVVDDEVATPATGDVGLLRVTRTLTYYRTAFHLRDRDRGSTVATVTPPGW